MKPLLIAIIGVLFLAGCATTYRMDRVSVGMTKEQVVAAVGRPDSSASSGNGVEYIRYDLEAHTGGIATYFVKLVNGKVDSYGPEDDRAR